MKLSRVIVLLVVLWSAAALVQADNASLASLFTNSAGNATALRPGLCRASIIFIACDGLARSDLSCYGQTNFQTPNLDRLAAQGMRFASYRAGGDDLPQAQAALMTGNPAAPASGDTLASRLQRTGYRTGLIGEWALGPEPWKQGFDDFAGFLNESEADNYYSDFIWRYAQNRVREGTNLVFHPRFVREQIYRNAGGRKAEFVPDFLVAMALAFVRVNVPDAANHYQPFFLLLNLPLPRSVTPGKDDYPVPTDAPFTDEPWPQAAKNRAALVTRLDSGIGRLLQQLQKSGLTNNVAIFFAGETAPKKFAEASLDFLRLKEEVRGGTSPDRLLVPMIAWWPGRVPGGRTAQTPCSAADFAPTVLEIAGAKPAPGLAGASLLPQLSGKP